MNNKREIKFRYRFTDGKSWIMTTYDLGQIINGQPYDDMSDIPTLKKYKHVGEDQFTGLRDKNGTEIFEGDIVTAWSEGAKGTFEVKWRQEGAPMWILFPAWQHRKMWSWDNLYHWNLHGSSNHLTGFITDDVEIIGNIYQTPELIPSAA